MGYIPACAGETVFDSSFVPPGRTGTSPRVRGKQILGIVIGAHDEVHPRVCGGNNINGKTQETKEGTSPRVRGKHQVCGAECYSMIDQVHPRVCGGNSADAGAPFRRTVVRGYIPACAGETTDDFYRSLSLHCKVHPRVCGGNSYI